MKNLYKKNKEVIMYLIFGVLTTLINILSYMMFNKLLKMDIYVSNAIAWILAVLFAYVTNRKYVFDSRVRRFKDKVREITSFYACRLLTFGVDMLSMYLLIDLFKIDDMVSKLIVNVIVIILNYVLSKLIIFKNNK
jgi:putative flippase GtrA